MIWTKGHRKVPVTAVDPSAEAIIKILELKDQIPESRWLKCKVRFPDGREDYVDLDDLSPAPDESASSAGGLHRAD